MRFANRTFSEGFTLIELIIVIVIIGILAGVAIPTYNGYQDKMKLRTALSQVEADLRNAQQKAKATGRSTTFAPSSPNSKSYTITGSSFSAITSELAGGVQFISPSDSITYNPPSSSSETSLSSTATITLQAPLGNRGALAISINGAISQAP